MCKWCYINSAWECHYSTSWEFRQLPLQVSNALNCLLMCIFKVLFSDLLAKVQSLAGPSQEESFGGGFSLACPPLCSLKAVDASQCLGPLVKAIGFDLGTCCF